MLALDNEDAVTVTGLSPTPRELLTWFRDPVTDDTDGTRPLTAEGLDEFVEFLQSW